MNQKCDHCGFKIVYSRDNGDKAIKNKVLLVKSDNKVYSVCPQCGKEICVENLHYIVLTKSENN